MVSSAYTRFVQPARLWPWLLIAVCSLLAQLYGLTPWLRYDRDEITHGANYRLLTAHLVHANEAHLAINLAGLIILALLFHRQLRASQFILEFVLLCLLTSVFIWLCDPVVMRYVGLSGVLHGLFTLGAMREWREGRGFGLVLLTGIVLKLFVERQHGGSLIYGSDHVLYTAHVAGFFSATLLLCAIAIPILYQRWRRNK